MTVLEAVRRSREERKGGYPVVDVQGRMVGIVTRTDFYRALRELRPPQTPLTEIMRTPVITVRESDPLAVVAGTFMREPVKRLVVVRDDDAGTPTGMLTPFDVMQALTPSPAPPPGGAP
jgi:CBS domain-containing protein